MVLTKCKTTLFKSKSMSGKCLTGREKEIMDRLIGEITKRTVKKEKSDSHGAHWAGGAGIAKGHDSDTQSDGEDEEPAWGVCIMWAKLSGSPGGFTAGRSSDINQTGRCCRQKIYSVATAPGNDWSDR